MNNDNHAFQLNKTLVKEAFNKASASYDEVAILQREIANRLDERLDFIKIHPEKILEIGSGTGYYTDLLSTRYPKTALVALDIAHSMHLAARSKLSWFTKLRHKRHWLCADAEKLPLTDNSIDMAASNLTINSASIPTEFTIFGRRYTAYNMPSIH